MTGESRAMSLHGRDLLMGILLLLFAGAFYALTYHFGGYEFEKVPYDMGAAFLPRLLLAAVAVEAICLILFSLHAILKAYKESGPKKPIWQLRPVIMLGAFLVYVYLATLFGYITSTIAFMILSFFLLGVRSIWILVVVPPVITLATYYLFGVVLNIYLPSGSLY